MTGVSGVKIKRLLEESRARRRAELEAAGALLSERESKLVKEAFISGFIARHLMEPGKTTVPKDHEIVARSAQVCLDHKDIYPNLSNYREQEGS